MADRSPLPAQVYALDLGSSALNPMLCLDGGAYPYSRVDISTRTAQHSRVTTFPLLWLELPATGSLPRPIADYHAFLRFGCLLPWSVAGSKHTQEGGAGSSGSLRLFCQTCASSGRVTRLPDK
jgi:hypothetical protein